MPEHIARLSVSAVRRWSGAIILALLGVSLIYSGIAYPPATVFARVMLFLLGVLLVSQGVWNLRAKDNSLILKDDGIWVEGGAQLVRLQDVETIQTSPFSFKPSNGFAVVLNHPVAMKWVPGLYWTLGRRVGIGGATNPAQAKAMADLLRGMLAQRPGSA